MTKLPEVVETAAGPTAVGSSSVVLRRLLRMFEERVVSAGAPADAWLEPGIDSQEVTQQLTSVGLVANDEVLAWFSWHNGTVRRGESQGLSSAIFPGFSQRSLDEAIENYRLMVMDFVVPESDDPIYYNRGVGSGWLLLSADAFGFAIDCRGADSKTPLVRKPEQEHFLTYFDNKLQVVSLCTLVTWWIEAIDAGATKWDAASRSWSEPDPSLFSQIRRDVSFV